MFPPTAFHQLPGVLILVNVFSNMLFNPRHLKPRISSLHLAFAQMDINNCFEVLCIQLEMEFSVAVIRLWKQSLRICRPVSLQRHPCYTLSKHPDGTKSGTEATAIALQKHHQIKWLYVVSFGGLDTTGKRTFPFILFAEDSSQYLLELRGGSRVDGTLLLKQSWHKQECSWIKRK